MDPFVFSGIYSTTSLGHYLSFKGHHHLIRQILKKTPYELYKRRKLNISHLRVFGYKCFILNNRKESLDKFDAKADGTIFLSYSLQSKTYRVFNRRTLCVE